MNMMLSGFSGEPSDAKGIITKELIVDRKTVPTVFFMVHYKKTWYIPKLFYIGTEGYNWTIILNTKTEECTWN
jgi:hypothetical protein